GWHPPSLRTAPAKGIWTPKLSYQRPENGEQVIGYVPHYQKNPRSWETGHVPLLSVALSIEFREWPGLVESRHSL
ncbi:hypothetical protein, partial [Sphingomonas sp. PP-CE-1G-424]|uniref:hypothetical protein n=1 Tax=Sphingomonas sp. PP-CE-1G-424 TaxID=2135658 RepID=UPI001A9CC05B